MDDAQRAFGEFVERTFRPLSRLAFLLTSDHAAADDLTGDTLLAVWRQWDRIQEVDDVNAYVNRIMANLAATRVRRSVVERARLEQVGLPEETPEADPAVTVTVQAAVAALPAGRRACVVLRHAFGLSEKEVAQALGVSVGTVKSQTSKAIRQLAKSLGDEWPGDR